MATTYNYTPTALELFQLEGGKDAHQALNSLWEEGLLKLVINVATNDGEGFEFDMLISPEMTSSAYLAQWNNITTIEEWVQTAALHLCFNLKNDDGGRFNLTLEREGNNIKLKCAAFTYFVQESQELQIEEDFTTTN